MRIKKTIHAKLPVPGTDSWLDEKQFSLWSPKAFSNFSVLFMYLSSDEYSNELNYYHFCWRIWTTSDCYLRCCCCVLQSMCGWADEIGSNAEEYKLPHSIICYYAVQFDSVAWWTQGMGGEIINMSYRFKHSSLKSSKLNQIHIFICRLNVAI